MFEWLEQLLNGKTFDSSKQLEQAKSERPSAENERIARSLGYKNAAEMIAFNRQRGGDPRTHRNPAKHAAKQGVDIVSTMHPKNILDYVTAALEESRREK